MYVGDAGGRLVTKGKKKDFSCSDRKFAFNIGIPYSTPEEFFLHEKPSKFEWDAVDLERALGATGDIIDGGIEKLTAGSPEVIVLVGFPGSGKSTLAKTYMVPKGYVHVNQDTLKTFEKCLKVAKEAINNNQSVVVDNTSPSVDHRKHFIQAANKAGMPARCFYFSMDMNLSKHLNYFRERKGEKKHVPTIAYNVFKGQYEEPSVKEGFTEVKRIRFIPKFKDEDEKKLFCKYA